MSLRKNYVDDLERTVYATLDIEHADDWSVRLTDYAGMPVERASLGAKAESDLAAWIESWREEYRQYERDQAEEMRAERAFQRGMRWPYNVGRA